MAKTDLVLTPAVAIPSHLVGEVQSKLAYVDETIVNAMVAERGDQITLQLNRPAEPERQSELAEKVQRVVTTMVKGAFKPKVQVLEDHLDRPVPNHTDPMPD